ncbi:MAG: DUF1501 domain-containing protein, partial [Acidobacteria bacterium]|nr:DUF1501 domain-containing protein [Acidobacteriota bacterium]
MLTRRVFLRGSAIVMAGMGVAPGWLVRTAAAENKKRKTLVAIFLRGAADGLNIVVPFGDKRYKELRPTLAVAPPSNQGNAIAAAALAALPAGVNVAGLNTGTIDLDGYFGLNGAMQPLKALWDKHQLAIIEATGSSDNSRSHFEAQDAMESGTLGNTPGNGWLNRALPPAAEGAYALRAIALSNQVPRALRGDHEAIAVGNLQQFTVGNQDAAAIMQSMYATTPDASLGRTGKDAFEAMKIIQSIQNAPQDPQPAFAPNVPQYGQAGDFGRNLQQLARLLKAEAGVEAVFADIGGWDHHGNENGQLPNLLRQFSTGIAAFSNDMGDRMEDVVLVTMSEFGRTAQENGNGGTDHGHGSFMMVMGGPVQGGKIYGKWPGLEKEQLFEGRDLAVTTDYRAVLSEL